LEHFNNPEWVERQIEKNRSKLESASPAHKEILQIRIKRYEEQLKELRAAETETEAPDAAAEPQAVEDETAETDTTGPDSTDFGIAGDNLGGTDRKEHEDYHGRGRFPDVISSIAGEIGAGVRPDGRFDLWSVVENVPGNRIETSHGEIYITKDGILVIIDSRFQKDHAGRGELAVYARTTAKAQHELTELRGWIDFVVDKGVARETILSGEADLGRILRNYMNGVGESLTPEQLAARRQEVFRQKDYLHQNGLEAEATSLREQSEQQAGMTEIDSLAVKNGKSALIIYADEETDWNGALNNLLTLREELEARGYTVRNTRVGSVDSLIEKIELYTEANPVDLLIIGAHGRQRAMILGNGLDGELTLQNAHRLYGVNSSLAMGGTIVLKSCSTARGEGLEKNMANTVAGIFSQAEHVFAPRVTAGSRFVFDTDNQVAGIKYDNAEGAGSISSVNLRTHDTNLTERGYDAIAGRRIAEEIIRTIDRADMDFIISSEGEKTAPEEIFNSSEVMGANAGELRKGETVTVMVNGRSYEVTAEDGANLMEALENTISPADYAIVEKAAIAEFGEAILPHEANSFAGRRSDKAAIKIDLDGRIVYMNSTVTVRKSDAAAAEAGALQWAHTHPKTHEHHDEFLPDIAAAVKVADHLGVGLETIVQHIGERGEDGQVEQIMRLRFAGEQPILEKLNSATGKYALAHEFNRKDVAAIREAPMVTVSTLPADGPRESMFAVSIRGRAITAILKPVGDDMEFTLKHSITQEQTARTADGIGEGILKAAPASFAPIVTSFGAVALPLETGQDIGSLEGIVQEIEETGAPSTESMRTLLENRAGPNQGVNVLVYEAGTVDEPVQDLLDEKQNKKTFLRVVVIKKGAEGTIAKRIGDAIRDQVGDVEIAQVAVALKGQEDQQAQEQEILDYLNRYQEKPINMPSIVVLEQNSENNLRLNMANMLLSMLGNTPCFVGLGYDDENAFSKVRSLLDRIGGYFRVIEQVSEGLSEIFKAIRSTLSAV